MPFIKEAFTILTSVLTTLEIGMVAKSVLVRPGSILLSVSKLVMLARELEAS